MFDIYCPCERANLHQKLSVEYSRYVKKDSQDVQRKTFCSTHYSVLSVSSIVFWFASSMFCCCSPFSDGNLPIGKGGKLPPVSLRLNPPGGKGSPGNRMAEPGALFTVGRVGKLWGPR